MARGFCEINKAYYSIINFMFNPTTTQPLILRPLKVYYHGYQETFFNQLLSRLTF